MGQPYLTHGQPSLFPHGIQTENSHIRCHVAPLTRKIFVFQTAVVLPLIWSGKYEKRTAGQAGVAYKTAEGYVIPTEDIPDLRTIYWAEAEWWERFDEGQSTSQKGKHAVDVVRGLLEIGRFPLWAIGYETKQVDLQIKGTDILVSGQWRIQVKCDYKAGKASDGTGTGNLFLQVAELNPLRRI